MKPMIISMSLPEDSLSCLEKLQKSLELKGRSETIREAINALEARAKNLNSLKGKISAVATIIHKEKHSKEISSLVHKYSEIIKTHIHNHLGNNKCAEVLVLEGKAEYIRSLIKKTQGNKRLEKIELIVC